MDYLYASILFLLNTLGAFLVVLGLPGTWFMVLSSVLVSWISGRWIISVPTLIALASLAFLGEVVELLAGAAGSRKAGGSRRGTAGALLGGIAGGIAGTFVLPVVGSIIGACLGAFLGAIAGELSIGKKMDLALNVGWSALWGRFLGTLGKLAAAVLIWIVATVASFF